VPSVVLGTAATQFPVTFGCTGVALGAAATGGGVVITRADAQPERIVLVNAEAINRTG
jgi:hypothetical protein